ncbi:MAG TPA: MATE family efflux transporter, partial [Sandaracinaceae bacterium LLY-WYZ-13_1]|nr:MATE family efflux transporter [Sandaracinaceae bacterium LLY-WYZ-13_1]
MAEASEGRGEVTHRAILGIAVPIMISNVSTPLLGVVDTAVVGQIPDPAYIGAVAVGALIFSFVFWGFGFLRMGTTGLTAQALGAGDAAELRAALGRAVGIGLVAGAALVALQWPIRELAFVLLEGSTQVERLARGYFDIRIWAAPATLVNYALLGWFIGLGRARTALVLQLVLNVTNIALDALFVLGFGWDVRGVALGTLCAEVLAAGVGLALAAGALRDHGGRWERDRLLDAARLKRTVAVNRDIMIRSLALVSVFVFFMARGAAHGDVVLAANAVLMQLVNVSAFFLDGIAFSAEALVGRAMGAGRRDRLVRAARLTTVWAIGIAALVCAVYAAGGAAFVDRLTVDPEARAAARAYLPWAVLAPLAGVGCFQLDGIFIGATRTADMRNAMLASLAVFFLGWWALTPFGNHGLWGSLYVHYGARTVSLLVLLPGLVRAAEAPPRPVRRTDGGGGARDAVGGSALATSDSTIAARRGQHRAMSDEALEATLARVEALPEGDPAASLRADAATLAGPETWERPVAAAETLPRVDLDASEITGADLRAIETLGQGGMGKVVLASQRTLRRQVAVKLAHVERSPALLHEGVITGMLEHPNIPPIHALGRDADGRVVLVMKRIEGVTWAEVLGDPEHPLRESSPLFGGADELAGHLEIVTQLANALELAHERGVIHRDIKPENVMLGAFGEVYLID